MEQWKWIPGYENHYMISTNGVVKSFKNGKEYIRSLEVDKNGYLRIRLYKNGATSKFMVHRLVALTFIENPLNKEQINHINEDKQDNRIENLEWSTPKENANFGTRNSRMAEAKCKPVLQFDKDMNFIAEYGSLREAETITQIKYINISAVLHGKQKTAGGFKWTFKEEE